MAADATEKHDKRQTICWRQKTYEILKQNNDNQFFMMMDYLLRAFQTQNYRWDVCCFFRKRTRIFLKTFRNWLTGIIVYNGDDKQTSLELDGHSVDWRFRCVSRAKNIWIKCCSTWCWLSVDTSRISLNPAGFYPLSTKRTWQIYETDCQVNTKNTKKTQTNTNCMRLIVIRLVDLFAKYETKA